MVPTQAIIRCRREPLWFRRPHVLATIETVRTAGVRTYEDLNQSDRSIVLRSGWRDDDTVREDTMKKRLQKAVLFTAVGGALGFGISLAYSYLGST